MSKYILGIILVALAVMALLLPMYAPSTSLTGFERALSMGCGACFVVFAVRTLFID